MSLRGGLFLRRVPAVVRGNCVCSFSVFFAFPLDAGVWRLPAMALGRMRGYVTKKKKKKKGPFPITKVVGKWAFRVQLPKRSQAHPTFHVQLLEPYRVSREESRRQRPPTPEPIDGEVNYVVEEIVESCRNNRKKGKPIEYLVLWEGYPDEEGTWETYDKLKGTAEEALQEFQDRNPIAD